MYSLFFEHLTNSCGLQSHDCEASDWNRLILVRPWFSPRPRGQPLQLRVTSDSWSFEYSLCSLDAFGRMFIDRIVEVLCASLAQ